MAWLIVIDELRKRSISRPTAWRSASASPSVSLWSAVGVLAVTIACDGAARSSAGKAIASSCKVRRLAVVMLETFGLRVCRMIVKNSRPALAKAGRGAHGGQYLP
jgi:hypothetical protein